MYYLLKLENNNFKLNWYNSKMILLLFMDCTTYEKTLEKKKTKNRKFLEQMME